MSARLLILVVAICSITPSARADDTSGGSGGDVFWVEQVQDRPPKPTPDPVGGPPDSDGGYLSVGESACVGAELVADPDLSGPQEIAFCAESHTTSLQLTAGMIRRAFAELRLPASTLVIQPPDGLTLVNFDTNFYTTSTRPLTRTVTLLGQRVTLEATPSTYHWTFGDGRELSTSHPGAPYPDLTVTHNYLRKGTYRPSLATTYTGRYRVGGGPWRSITGTVTIEGSGQPLRAIEAQPKLVGY